MASAPISQQPRVFYCYSSTTRNGENKENTITFEARDPGSNETKYIMQGIKPDKSQIASTTLRRELPPQHTCLQTFISPITPGNPDIDSITGRPLTHRLSSGLVVTEVPVTGYWRPRKFEFKGRNGEAEFETVKPAVASKTMPFWAGLFMSRYLEVRVAEGVEEALLEVILAGALTESMVTLHGH
ncbi:hypothetical protein CNMCM8927_007461 [Aspergillus lentulus]|uniref:Uncharacterized protein n=1 Tax=Aspergillus lentulus TaxID=293939 RepID=A0AAN5YWC8_ASPLE|nr:hypothetical protein CNMCM8927_007461 [Aspergillus lentulus]